MKVFISHSSSEKWVARRISEDIRALGFETFLDEKDIGTGDPIDDSIHEQLADCDHFLLLLSPASLKSHWVLVELGGALALRKRVVPVLLYVSPNEIPDPIKKYLARDINELDRYYQELKGKPPTIEPTRKDDASVAPAKDGFKVGERVQLPAQPMPTSGVIGWNSERGMDAYCGKDATITELWRGAGARVDIDNGKFVWAFDWLSHVR